MLVLDCIHTREYIPSPLLPDLADCSLCVCPIAGQMPHACFRRMLHFGFTLSDAGVFLNGASTLSQRDVQSSSKEVAEMSLESA